jgi:hypothetical protein
MVHVKQPLELLRIRSDPGIFLSRDLIKANKCIFTITTTLIYVCNTLSFCFSPLSRAVEANRSNIVKALQSYKGSPEEPKAAAGKFGPSGATVAEKHRRGGMIGMVPDGILGAFRSKPGVDELVIGSKRGLLRIAVQEGATVYAAW